MQELNSELNIIHLRITATDVEMNVWMWLVNTHTHFV